MSRIVLVMRLKTPLLPINSVGIPSARAASAPSWIEMAEARARLVERQISAPRPVKVWVKVFVILFIKIYRISQLLKWCAYFTIYVLKKQFLQNRRLSSRGEWVTIKDSNIFDEVNNRKIKKASAEAILWRRVGDSNSRCRSPHTSDLANRPLQPLG